MQLLKVYQQMTTLVLVQVGDEWIPVTCLTVAWSCVQPFHGEWQDAVECLCQPGQWRANHSCAH